MGDKMGRVLKRVPLDFNWPLNKIWGGYINPYSSKSVTCPECNSSGQSLEYEALQDKWYGYSTFKPEDRGSIPFLPTDTIIRECAERNVNRDTSYYGTGETAIVREANRLCNLFNKSWSHHLNDEDVAILIADNRLLELTHDWKDGKWQPKEPQYIPTAKEVNEWSLQGMGHDSIDCWVVVEAECKKLGYETECSHCNGEGELWPSQEIKQLHDTWVEVEPPIGEGYQLWETTSEGSPVSPVFTAIEELCE